MALGRKRGNGLDLSGVGKRSNKVSGGRAKSRSGVVMAPHAGLSGGTRSVMSGGGSSRDAFAGGRSRRPGIPRRSLALGALVVLAAIALAAFVGYMVYQQTVRNALKPEIDPAALSSVLVQPSDEEQVASTWSLLVHTDASSAEEGRGNLTHLSLAHADTDNKSLTLLWIPARTRVYIDGYGYRSIADAFALGHDAVLVRAVGKLTNVDIAHYLEANDSGLRRLEEQLGVPDGEVSQEDPTGVVAALAKRIFGSSSEQIATRAGYVASCAATDMDEESLTEFCTSLQGLNADSELYAQTMPVTEQQSDGVTYVVVKQQEWASMIARVSNGMPPVATKRELGGYEQMRKTHEVAIWNGVGVSGVAADCAAELEKGGWQIGSTGNAAQFVYDETLVVYKENEDEEVAELLVSDLGQGRVVRSAMRYSFVGDVLVVVGQDYQPH